MTCKKYAGTLIDRISIEQYTSGKDEVGAPVDTWAEKIEVAASVEHITGDESEVYTAETAETKVNFIIAYRNDLDTRHRVVFESNTYDILGFLDLDNKFLFMKILTRLVE